MEFSRNSPGHMMSLMFRMVAAVLATSSEWVSTLILRLPRSNMASSLGVVPVSRKIESPSLIYSMHLAAMRFFSAALISLLKLMLHSNSEPLFSTAPPCSSVTMPSSAIAFRSRRMVIEDTWIRSARSVITTLPLRCSSSRI